MQFSALPTASGRALQSGGLDAYENPPERAMSNGVGTPCRHCLQDIAAGKDMLILAYRPFGGLHPYAETGPIFLCADDCDQGGGTNLPAVLQTSPTYLIKGYCSADRIVYGTGAVVPAQDIALSAARIFDDPNIAYIHVRSARNNCYLARIDRK
jgi:hypothetical protein